MKYDELTHSQKAAVDQRGSILVSAAAGSGKTAVLVERIIKELTAEDDHINADRLLVVTFTVAAAAEMRSRIEKGLDDYCAEHPDDTNALKQKLLLQSAKICTIDSFCIDMVRENFAKAGVAPDFKIAEDKDIFLMEEKALSKVFAKYFESDDQDFIKLLNAFGSVYDEGELMKAVKKIYNFSQNLPFPEKWFELAEDRYTPQSFDMWCDLAFKEAKRRISIASRFVKATEPYFDNDEDVKNAYSKTLEDAGETCDKLNEAADNRDWDALKNGLDYKWKSFGSISKSKENPNAVAVTALRDLCKAQLDKIKKIFDADLAVVKTRFLDNAPTSKTLIHLSREYAKAFNQEKKENNCYTFSDIEHLAFSLICRLVDGEAVLTDEAKEYVENFDEVLVDEYQDVNDLQDTFFHYLSDYGKHLFVVGDVKQSIYGFRGANPENFIEKINESVKYDIAGEDDIKSIVLDANFRSRSGICDFVNFTFDKLMTKDTSGISYMDTERLSPKAKYPESEEPCAEVHIIESNDNKKEAIHIADCIEKVMASGEIITDEKTKELRKAKYSDFAVLVRNMKKTASFIAEELKRRGIPVSYTKENFLEAQEIKVMLAFLRVIDNPTRDVELLSAMMSPLFGFTAEDLAEIRCAKRNSRLYNAVVLSAKNGNDKCKKFIEYITDLRKSAVVLPLPKLITKIYDTTGFLNITEMMNDGQARSANLLRLVDIASSVSSAGNNDIGNFLDTLDKFDEKKFKGATLSSGSNSVRIMTIHNSKGLQFPVCILGYTGSKFNTADETEKVMADAEYGVSFRYYNEEGNVTTLDKTLLSSFYHTRLLKEELRLLYVALTRAKEKLIITMAQPNVQNKLNKTALSIESSGMTVSEDMYSSAQNYADWIIPCSLLHPDGGKLRVQTCMVECDDGFREKAVIDVYDVKDEEISADEQNKTEDAESLCNRELAQEIKKRINSVYRYDVLRSVEAKASVSDIVHKAEIGNYDFTSAPGFLNKNGLTPTARGTAVHKIMQFMDYAAARKDFDAEIERLKEWEYITEEEAKVDTVHVRRFVRSSLFDRICASGKAEREMQFLTSMPALLIKPDLPEEFKDEKIIVQGAVDLMFYEPDGIVIVDFKTDRVKEEKQLIDAYAEQLRIYSDACEKITGLPVKEKIIYSLVLDRSIVV